MKTRSAPRITDYFKHHQPDELIDDAILAYAEDCIVALPDVVVAKWDCRRFYELERFPCSVARHQTCESWFENGCRFVSEEHTPRLVHFWTSFDIEGAIASTRHPGTGLAGDLQSGTRLSLVLESNGAVSVVHRTRGLVGFLPNALSNSLHQVPLRDRKYLALVDKVEPAQQIFGSKPAETRVHVSAENRRPGCQLLVTCQLLVMYGVPRCFQG